MARALALEAPRPGEVVLEVAGSALGAQPGAELCGRVIAAGEAAAEWVGQRVLVPRLLPCGECAACRRARPSRCGSKSPRGPVAEHAVVPARWLTALEPPLAVDDGALWRWAALADAAAAPYGGLVAAQLAPGDVVVVIGGGVRGRFACAIAKALGAHPAILDRDAARRAAAGARFQLDGAALDPAGARRTLEAEARVAGIERFELKVIETTGTAAGRRRAVALVEAGGTAALLGDGDGGEVTAPLDGLAESAAAVVGAGPCHPDLYPELCALASRGELDLAAHTERLPFDALADALAARREGRLAALPILGPR